MRSQFHRKYISLDDINIIFDSSHSVIGDMTGLLPVELMHMIFEFILNTLKVPIWNLMFVNRRWRNILYNWSLFWSRFSVVGRISSLPPRFLELGLYPRVCSTSSLLHVMSKIKENPIHLTILLEYGPYIGVPRPEFYRILRQLIDDYSHKITDFTIRIVYDSSWPTPKLPRNRTMMRKKIIYNKSLNNSQEREIQNSLLYIFGDRIANITKLVIEDPGRAYSAAITYLLWPQKQITHLEFLSPKPFDVSWLAKFPQLETCILYHLSQERPFKPFTLSHLHTLVITISTFWTIAIVRAPSLGRLLLHKEGYISPESSLPDIHFPALCSLRISHPRGHFIPNFPRLENVHLGVKQIEELWLQRLFMNTPGTSSPKRLSIDLLWPVDIVKFFSLISGIPQVQTLQINVINQTEDVKCGEKLLMGLCSSVLPGLRCLAISFLEHVEGIAGYVEDVKRIQPQLQGFIYIPAEDSDVMCVVLRCTNEAHDCCEALQQAFDQPDHKFCLTMYQDD
jgi:hypothetical protein